MRETIQRRRYTTFMYCCYLIVSMLTGCGPPRAITIEGYVRTKSNLATSVITPRLQAHRDERPIGRATVFLSLNVNGTSIVPNTKTQTDWSGHYLISVETMEIEPFLIVIKEGYESYVGRIQTGRLSHYRENTVVLRSLSE